MKGFIKVEFLQDFAGKSKGYTSEYSKDNANTLIKKGIAKVFEEKEVKAKKTPKTEK